MLKKASLVNIQMKMNENLLYTMCTIYISAKFLLPSNISRFIAIAFGLLVANWPLLRFVIGVHKDKGWILSIMGIENDHIIPISKIEKLSDIVLFAEFFVLYFVLWEWSIRYIFAFVGIALLILFTSRMITQFMGYYIYWIARINNDQKLRVNAPDNIIAERSLEAAKLNYNGAYVFIILLLITLSVYSFTVSFFSITFSAKMEFVLHSVLLLCLIILTFILGQLFNKNTILLNIFQMEFFEEQYAIIKSVMKKQLFFMKFLFFIFVFAEVIILPEIIKVFM